MLRASTADNFFVTGDIFGAACFILSILHEFVLPCFTEAITADWLPFLLKSITYIIAVTITFGGIVIILVSNALTLVLFMMYGAGFQPARGCGSLTVSSRDRHAGRKGKVRHGFSESAVFGYYHHMLHHSNSERLE